MDKTLVVYWSGTGNTEAMAKAIESGLKAAGAETTLVEAGKADAALVDGYAKIAFGCPAMGAEVLEETVFEPFFAAVEEKLAGKKTALFGSYDWGDGEWMRVWEERVRKAGAALFAPGLIVQAANAPAFLTRSSQTRIHSPSPQS